MSPTHRPAETPAEPAGLPHDGTPSRLVPKWARAGAARPRKIIPLRLAATPQIAAAPPGGSAGRVSGSDLQAQDAVFRQLLSAQSDPLAAQPVRDPVGLALGVVARLIVAACAAAAVTMLLVGALPMPTRPFVAAKTDRVAPSVSAPAIETADAARRRDTGPVAPSAAPTVKQASTAGEARPAADAAPVRVSTVSVHARPDGADQAALEPDEVARLVKRGEDALAQGDIAAARLILGRAAEARDARAALSIGGTFDPAVLRQLHVIGFRPDIAQARAWYERAAAYGSVEATQRIAALPHLER